MRVILSTATKGSESGSPQTGLRLWGGKPKDPRLPLHLHLHLQFWLSFPKGICFCFAFAFLFPALCSLSSARKKQPQA